MKFDKRKVTPFRITILVNVIRSLSILLFKIHWFLYFLLIPSISYLLENTMLHEDRTNKGYRKDCLDV